MAYKNQQQFIEALEKAGELVRIKTYVDPKLEMAEITDRVSKSGNGGKALLFTIQAISGVTISDNYTSFISLIFLIFFAALISSLCLNDIKHLKKS